MVTQPFAAKASGCEASPIPHRTVRPKSKPEALLLGRPAVHLLLLVLERLGTHLRRGLRSQASTLGPFGLAKSIGSAL